uniref:3'-5' exonuclease domain-containing protein n=1 Tax=Tetraselmis chuii TaxID=63592 RepID=A0A7S1SY78_9CHLO|mmetsp:Transcript_36020/g.64401  ORF Transcript_36020/g.64401 Transcript_36020/m.64401 type:complete len:583 (+) Transcript_36020:465-2213(+)
MPVRTSTTYSTSTTACSKWFATSRTAKNYWRRPTGGRRRSHCCYTRSRCMGRRCGAPPSRSFVNFCTERREKRRGAAMLCGTASTRCASGGTLSRGGLTRARSMSCRMKPCWRWPPGVDAIRARSWFPPSLPLCRGASRTGSTGTAARRRKCRGWCRVTRRSCFACCHARRKGGCRGRRSTCCSWLAVATGSHPARPPKRPERTCGSGWSSSSAQSRPCTKTVGCSVRPVCAKDGELLCHCDRRKMRWYLERGLATLVADQENTIRLNFQHQNTGKADASNRFYATSKSNHCVVCGESGHYLRYRVVPSCYRRHFPLHLKTHRSHDIVLVCISCHEAAQVVADEVKRELAAEHDIPLNPPPLAPPASLVSAAGDNGGGSGGTKAAGDSSGQEAAGVHPYNARRAAQALSKNGDAMPASRREELEAVIKQFLGRSQGEEELPGLQPGDLDAALVAGVSRRRQRKMLQRYGRTAVMAKNGSDGDEGGEGSGAEEERERGESTGRYAPSSRSEEKDQWGHGWHGSRVVARILEKGGEEELLDLIRRFRERFVERLSPRFMPPGWEVDHSAAREFGKHSIYYGQAG